MKCEAKWIDKNGKTTPDENEAVMMAHCHKSIWKTPTGSPDNCIVGYEHEIHTSFPICATHYAMVRYNWRFENGGAWTFTAIAPEGN